MQAGKRNQRITLQQRTTTTDGLGQDVVVWSDVAKVWARALPLRSREFFAARQIQEEDTVRFVILARADVAKTWRLIWKGVAHDITGVIPLTDDPGFMEIMALAGVKDGR